MGYNALTAITTGTGSTCLGALAGSSLTTGSNNVCIGYNTQVNTTTFTSLSAATSSDTLNIGSDATRFTMISIGPYCILRFPLSSGHADNVALNVFKIPLASGAGACMQIYLSSISTTTLVSSAEVLLSASNVAGTITSGLTSRTRVTGGAVPTIGNTNNAADVTITYTVNNAGTPTFTLGVVIVNYSPSDVQIVSLL